MASADVSDAKIVVFFDRDKHYASGYRWSDFHGNFQEHCAGSTNQSMRKK